MYQNGTHLHFIQLPAFWHYHLPKPWGTIYTQEQWMLSFK